jgi:hypothetical protein
MMRIKLFGLFIAFALLALVRPRKCLELLEAADAGAKAQADKDLIERQNALVQLVPEEDIGCLREQASAWRAVTEVLDNVCPDWHISAAPSKGMDLAVASIKKMAQECPLPPAGWRCTRRAGHDGPCAAVVK